MSNRVLERVLAIGCRLDQRSARFCSGSFTTQIPCPLPRQLFSGAKIPLTKPLAQVPGISNHLSMKLGTRRRIDRSVVDRTGCVGTAGQVIDEPHQPGPRAKDQKGGQAVNDSRTNIESAVIGGERRCVCKGRATAASTASATDRPLSCSRLAVNAKRGHAAATSKTRKAQWSRECVGVNECAVGASRSVQGLGTGWANGRRGREG
jgi:hypothetical protein